METNNKNQTDQERSWEKAVLKYARPDTGKSIWQIVNSLVPYLIILYVMYRSLEFPYWVTLLLSLLATGFLIRIFIIFHDCGHGSFFRSKKANKVIGMIMGTIAFTPYYSWHHQHWVHHSTAANLDRRGVGDVMTMTVDEYLKSSKWKRFMYRAFRNPYIMFTIGPVLVVFLKNRLTHKSMTRAEKLNIFLTNIVVLSMAAGISLLIGVKAYLLIQIPVILISHSVGLWLFYIQHQFDDVTWDRAEEWNYKTAAMNGSSFLKLPAILQWFTGNIGFHHVHHLSSRIPNYKLAACHYENEIFRNVRPIMLSETFKALKMSLWDEGERRLISFKKLKLSTGSI